MILPLDLPLALPPFAVGVFLGCILLLPTNGVEVAILCRVLDIACDISRLVDEGGVGGRPVDGRREASPAIGAAASRRLRNMAAEPSYSAKSSSAYIAFSPHAMDEGLMARD